MRTKKLSKRFLRDKSGAMTVEWIAIAAAVTVGAIAITWSTLDGLDPVAARIGSNLNDAAGGASGGDSGSDSGG